MMISPQTKFALASLALTAALLAACAGTPADSASEVATLVAAQLQTEAAASPSNTPPASATAPPSATAEPTATDAAGSWPEVVFLPGGLFDQAERDLIMAKVIDPFIHYHRDLAGDAGLLTITVEHYEDDPAWLYVIEAIYVGGGYEGWLAPATSGLLDWWIPECMGPCPLSDSFRAAYPEISATVEP